jgi:hypothetical protein
MPRFSEDDVIDFKVLEALEFKAAAEEQEQKKSEGRAQSGLHGHRDEEFLRRARSA